MNPVQVYEANNSERISSVRELLHEYGYEIRSLDPALGDYAAELANLPGEYGRPEGCLLLGTYEGKPAGCVAYRTIEPGICEMKRLFVSPRFQGKRVGYYMVERLIAEARVTSFALMRLDSHPWMKAAFSLYQRFGFTEIKRYNQNPTKGIRFFEKAL